MPVTMDTFKPGRLYLFIGKSRSGKSHTIKYFLQDMAINRQLFSFGIVFFGSSAVSNDYSWMPEKARIEGYSDELLNGYVEKLETMKKDKGELPHNFMIFDDLLGQLNNSDSFKSWISRFRHYNTTIFIANQYLASAATGTLLREQTSYGFFWKTSSKRTLSTIFEWYGQMGFSNYEEFCRHFRYATKKPYAAMVYIDDPEVDEVDESPTKNNYVQFITPAEINVLTLKF